MMIPALTGQASFSIPFFSQSATENHYLVTDQSFIIRSQISVLNFKFTSFHLLRSVSIERKSCSMITRIMLYWSCHNSSLCKTREYVLIKGLPHNFAVRNSGISCLASIFDWSNSKMKVFQAKNWFKFARYDKSYLLY